MENIIEPTLEYDFSSLYLGPPSSLAQGSYFTRIMYGTNKPLYIQTPKSLTKQGFIKSGKKIYTDLMFDNTDTVLIQWLENLETTCQDLIYNKGQSWFETKLEKDDIESAFTPSIKVYKSGKYYLLRVNVKSNVKIYDELDHILSCEDIKPENNVISIIEVQGIKFTSKNFQIEFELKQSMIVSPDPFLDECFIKKPNKNGEKIKKNNEVNSENILTPDILKEFIDESVKDLEGKQIGKKDNTLNVKKNEVIDMENYLVNNMENNLVNDMTNDIAIDIGENIDLELEDLDKKDIDEQKLNNLLLEVDINNNFINKEDKGITLKKPNQVYYEIYKKAREKAKEAKSLALKAYFEMKNIKTTYMLDNIDESDSDFEEFESNKYNKDLEGYQTDENSLEE
jgi:hypothetical protein